MWLPLRSHILQDLPEPNVTKQLFLLDSKVIKSAVFPISYYFFIQMDSVKNDVESPLRKGGYRG